MLSWEQVGSERWLEGLRGTMKCFRVTASAAIGDILAVLCVTVHAKDEQTWATTRVIAVGPNINALIYQ